jgi:hypothetical protein
MQAKKTVLLILLAFIIIVFLINLAKHHHYKKIVSRVSDRDVPNKVFIIPNFLRPTDFVRIRDIVDSVHTTQGLHRSKNILRNGSSISHHNMGDTYYRDILRIYRGAPILEKIHNETGIDLQFAPKTDPNRLSLLFYVQPKDGIGWHYDGNNYYGNRWAGIYTIINQGKTPYEMSSAKFNYILDGQEHSINTQPNSLVLFQGDKIRHKVDPIKKGEKRIVLSSVFCDVGERTLNPISLVYQSAVNLIFYGTL